MSNCSCLRYKKTKLIEMILFLKKYIFIGVLTCTLNKIKILNLVTLIGYKIHWY